MVKFCRSMLVVVFAACLAASIAPAHAQTGPDGGVLLTEDEAYRRDAEAYVQAYGGTIEEAVQHLKLQQAIAELDQKLQAGMPDTFGGLWIEHTPKFRVVIQLTKGDKKAIQSYLQKGVLADIVEVKNAPVSHKKLLEDQQDLVTTLEKAGVDVEGGADIKKSRLQIFVTDRAAVDAALAKAHKQLPWNADVTVVPELSRPTANWYAGLSVSGCTVGFTVQNGSGQRYSSAAGHCTSSSIQPMTQVGGIDNASYDLQWDNPPAGSTLRNWAADNTNDSTPYYRTITGFIARAPIGMFLCHYGKTTGYGCGNVEQNYFCDTGCNFLEIRASSNAQPISCPGDSGGPWYSGSNAAGIMTAGYCSTSYSANLAVAMPIQGFLDYGLTPSTN